MTNNQTFASSLAYISDKLFPKTLAGSCYSPEIKLSVAPAAAAKSLQSCPTLSDPMDCSLPGSSIHGIFQARVLEWVAIAFSEWLLTV